MDGGTVHNWDLPSAIELCRNMGFDDEDIVIDAISCWGVTPLNTSLENMNSINMLLRYVNILILREIIIL
jgi:hypothetical protein